MTDLEKQLEQTASSLVLIIGHAYPDHRSLIPMSDARNVIDAIANYTIARATAQAIQQNQEKPNAPTTPTK